MSDDTLFPEKKPVYEELLKETTGIDSFKTFEQTVKEIRFCKNKLKDARDNQNRAAEIAKEPYRAEIEMLEEQIDSKSTAVQTYYLTHEEEIKSKKTLLPDVDFEEIHKIKIKFKKETSNA